MVMIGTVYDSNFEKIGRNVWVSLGSDFSNMKVYVSGSDDMIKLNCILSKGKVLDVDNFPSASSLSTGN